jgi:hypothetical protein
MCVEEDNGQSVWWWISILNLNTTLKTHLFMWLYLCNRILIWQYIQRIIRKGLGRCILCKSREETILPLLVEFQFIKEAWIEVLSLTNGKNSWQGASLEECIKRWMENKYLKDHKEAFTFFMSKAIWLTINSMIF